MALLVARRRVLSKAVPSTVAFDSVTTAGGNSTFTHTASAAGVTQGYLLVMAYTINLAVTCTIAGQNAPLIGSSSTHVFAFGLPVATVAANATFAVVLTSTGNVGGGSVLYGGVSQTGSTGATQADSGSTNPVTTTALSSTQRGMVVSSSTAFNPPINNPTATLSQGTGQLTQRWSTSAGWGGVNNNTFGYYDSSEISVENVAFNWTVGSTAPQSIFTLNLIGA